LLALAEAKDNGEAVKTLFTLMGVWGKHRWQGFIVRCGLSTYECALSTRVFSGTISTLKQITGEGRVVDFSSGASG
jgi:hypothetical protein